MNYHAITIQIAIRPHEVEGILPELIANTYRDAITAAAREASGLLLTDRDEVLKDEDSRPLLAKRLFACDVTVSAGTHPITPLDHEEEEG